MTLFRRLIIGDPRPTPLTVPKPDARDFEANLAAHWRD